jgi:hypothetical protein
MARWARLRHTRGASLSSLLCLAMLGAVAGYSTPCVDTTSECEQHVEEYDCAVEEMSANCCASCVAKRGIQCASEATLDSMLDTIRSACPIADVTHAAECQPVGRRACRDALLELSAHVKAAGAEDDACNAYLFRPQTAGLAVFWGSCAAAAAQPSTPPGSSPAAATAPPLGAATAHELRRALDADAPLVTLTADVDFQNSYAERDQDMYGCRALMVGLRNPLQLRGVVGRNGWVPTLTARFAVAYGALSIRNVRLAEYDYLAMCPQGALGSPDDYPGAVILQIGGFVALSDVIVSTKSPYVYGHAVVSDGGGGHSAVAETVITRARFQTFSKAAAASLGEASTTCAQPPGGSKVCYISVDQMRISANPARGLQVTGGRADPKMRCPAGATLVRENATCVWTRPRLACPEGTVPDHVASAQAGGGICVISSVVCPAGTTISADGEQCVRGATPLGGGGEGGGGSQAAAAAADCTCKGTDGQCPPCPACDVCPSPRGATTATGSSDGSGSTQGRCPPNSVLDAATGECRERLQYCPRAFRGNSFWPCSAAEAFLAWLGPDWCWGVHVALWNALVRFSPAQQCSIWSDRAVTSALAVVLYALLSWLLRRCNECCHCWRTHSRHDAEDLRRRAGLHRHHGEPIGRALSGGRFRDGPSRPRSSGPIDGILTVTGVRCRDLLAADDNGKSDPYVKLSLLQSLPGRSPRAGEEETFPQQSTVKPRTLHPSFEEDIFHFRLDNSNGTVELPRLRIAVMDEDTFKYDDFLGEVAIDLESVFEDEPGWYTTMAHTAEFSLSDPKKLVTPAHLEARLEEIRAELERHRDPDTVPRRLGRVELTMRFVPTHPHGKQMPAGPPPPPPPGGGRSPVRQRRSPSPGARGPAFGRSPSGNRSPRLSSARSSAAAAMSPRLSLEATTTSSRQKESSRNMAEWQAQEEVLRRRARNA